MKITISLSCGSSADMADIADGSVDMILTAPPFENTHHYSDSPEDLGNYTGAEYVAKLKVILKECFRVLKTTGNFFMNFKPQKVDGQASPTAELIIKAAVEEVGFLHAETMSIGKLNVKRLPKGKTLRNSEDLMFHFVKSKDYHCQHYALTTMRSWAEKTKYDHINDRLVPDSCDAASDLALPEKQVHHPAKMLPAVAERFVLYGSESQGIVLDPFCGSGTTLIAARKFHRNFCGLDLNQTYIDSVAEAMGFEKDPAVTPTPMEATEPPAAVAALPGKKWLNMDELSAYIGLAKATLYSMVSRGEIPIHKAGRLNRFDRDEIDQWMRGEWKPEPKK